VTSATVSKVGAISLSSTEIHDFWARWGGTGTAVW
jgi:hypothetical protein